jgi:chorismate dehydratase
LKDRPEISLVSYWNTLPFLFGLEATGMADQLYIQLDIPSVGGRKLLLGEVDIALTPVVALNRLPQAHVITNYCIGADGDVRTVCLFSHVPLDQVRIIYLDGHSMTSVQLVRLLLTDKGLYPELTSMQIGDPSVISGHSAALVIGDKAFSWHGKFPYMTDLSAAWKEMTGLPFVFAAWVSRYEVPEALEQGLNQAFEYGLSHLEEVAHKYANKDISAEELLLYFRKHISYTLDDKKKKGMELFLKMVRDLD